MDYFKFDLQLFADVVATIDVKLNADGFDSEAKTAQYYVKIDNTPKYKWLTSINSLADYDLTVADIIAMRTTDGAITVAVKESGTVAKVTADNAAALKGATVSVVKAFKAGEGGAVADNDSTAVTASIQIYEGKNVAMVKNVKSATTVAGSKADTIAFDATAGTKISVAAGNAVQAGFDEAATKGATFVNGGVFTSNGTDVTVVSGTVDVAAAGTIKVGTTAYAAPAGEPTRLKVTEGDTLPTLIKRPDPADATKTVASNIELPKGVSIVIGGAEAAAKANGTVVKNTATAGDTKVSVASDGTVTGLDSGDTFSIADSTAVGATTKTYKVVNVADPGYNYIAVSGDYSGVYKITDLSKASVTAVAGAADSVAEKDAAQQPTLISAFADNTTIALAAISSGTPCFAVYYDGGAILKVAPASVFNDAKDQAGAIGFFEIGVVEGKATVTYKNLDAASAEDCTVSKLAGNFAINFDAVKNEGLTAIDVSGLTSGDVSLTNVAQTVETVTGAKTTGYIAGSKPASSFALKLPETLAAGTYYWALGPTGSADARNVTAYTVLSTPAQPTTEAPADKAYFSVTVAADGEHAGKFKCTNLTFSNGGTTAPKDLTANQWQGVTIDATATTTLSAFTLDNELVGTYVIKAKRGTAILSEMTNLTVDWQGDPAVTVLYDPDGEASVDKSITLPATAKKEYWKVELDNTTGNPKYTITKVDVDAKGDDYFTVTRTVSGVSVAYTSGSVPPISLTGITTGSAKMPVKIKVDATGIDNTYTLDVTDGATGETTNVDFALSNVPAGTTVKGATTGKDTISYKETWENDISFTLANYLPTEEGASVYIEVLPDGTKATADGYRKTKLGSKFTPEGATPEAKAAFLAKKNYFMITKSGSAYTVTYVMTQNDEKETDGVTFKYLHIDLEAATKGATTIDATGLTKSDKIQLTAADAVDFKVTGAVAGLMVMGSVKLAPDAYTVDEKAIVTYIETFALENATLTFGAATSWWTVEDTGTHGAHVYTFTPSAVSVEGGDNSYFKVTVSDGDYTLSFTPKNGGVTAAQLGALSDKIVIDTAGKVAKDHTLILTNDKTVGVLNYNVQNLVKGSIVDPDYVGEGDELHYGKTFVMGSANTLTLDAEEGTKYYAVTTTGGDTTEGELTVSIAKNPIEIPADASEQEKADILAAVGNYFEVKTDDAGNNNNVTVKYHQAGGKKAIDLTGTKMIVNVNALAANDKAIITFGYDNADVQKYNVTGMAATNTISEAGTPAAGTGILDHSDKAYVDSFVIAGKGTAATPIELGTRDGLKVGDVEYYKVVRGDKSATGVYTYQITDVGINAAGLAAATDHYIKVEYGTKYGVTVTYMNTDGDINYDLAKKVGKVVTINAAGLSKDVTTLDITDTATNAGVNYALVNVPERITSDNIIGKDSGDTVAYAATATLALGQAITLADTAVQYFVVGGTKTAATVTASAEKPDDTKNYFTVTRSLVTTPPEHIKYTVSYTQAKNGTAFDLSDAKSGTLEIAAGALAYTSELDLANGTAKANYAVTGAKGGLTVSNGYSAVGQYDTVSYAQAFSGEPGVYYIKKHTEAGADQNKANFPNDLQTSITKADKDATFVKVTLTQDEDGVYSIAVAANGYHPNANTGIMGEGDDPAAHGATLSVVAPDTAGSKMNANDVAFAEITGVAKDSVLTGVNAATTVTTAALTKGDSVKINTVKYASGGGAISVLNAKGTSGTFELSLADGGMATLTGSKATFVNGDYEKATITANTGTGDGKVYVTFENGVITGVTGLDEGETLQVVKEAETDITYEYTYDKTTGYVTRVASGGETGTKYAAAADATINVINRGYNENTSQIVGNFTWVANPEDEHYYMSAASATGDANIKYATGSTATAQNNTYYIQATVTDLLGKKKLELASYKGNSKGLVDPVTDYKGTIKVDAEEQAVQINYTKKATDAFKVAFTNVKAGSVFGGMDTHTEEIADVTGDTIATVALLAGEQITVDTKVYTAASGGTTMSFLDGALTNGTITAANNNKIAGGYVISGVNGTIEVTVETKEGKTSISSIKKFAALDNAITITDADGTATTFVATDATNITKTVIKATGEQTVTALKITADGDVWNATGTTDIYNNFDWQTDDPAILLEGAGYFKFGDDPLTPTVAAVPAAKSIGKLANIDKAHAGDVYVKAEFKKTVPATVTTLTLTAYKVNDDGELVKADASDTTGKTVTVTPGLASEKFSFSNSGNSFNVEINKAADGSVFTNMNAKDLVKTVSLTKDTGKVTVNGDVYTPAANSTFVVFVENSNKTRLVEGAVLVKGTALEAANADGSIKETMTYTPSSKDGEEKDGVIVQYGKNNGSDPAKYGKATSITGLNTGESVTIVHTAADGKKTTYTYETLADAAGANLVCYYSDGTTVKYIDNTTPATTNISYEDATAQAAYDTDGHTFNVADTGAFDWATETNTTAYFAVTNDAGTVEARNAAISYTYKDYGKTFIYANYVKTGTVLTLKKATVGKNGDFSAGGAFAGTETVSVDAGGKTIVYADRTTDNMKSLVVTNAAAGTTIANWKDADKITTASLAAPTFNEDGSLKTSEKVSIGGHDYTAAEKGSLTIAGSNVTGGKFLLQGSDEKGANTITAFAENSDKSTQTQVVVYKTTTGNGVEAVVTNGKVTRLTGLGDGEEVWVTTTAKDKLGNEIDVANPGLVKYEAHKIDPPEEKAGHLKVTKTAADGTKYTHIFADPEQDILADSVAWTISSQANYSLFDFADSARGATGYFAAAQADGDTTGKKFKVPGGIVKQTGEDQPLTPGNTYLEVVSSKDSTGKITISSMRVVKLEKDGSKKGTFTEITGASVTPAVNVAAATVGSIEITAAANTIPLKITAAASKIYTGLDKDDTLSFTGAAGNKVTVNGITYVAGDANEILINGNGAIDGLSAASTIQSGTLAIKDGVITDEAGNQIVGKEDGTATATFATKKGVTGLANMKEGESVTLTAANGTVTKWEAKENATPANDDITRTVTKDGVSEKWTKTIDDNADVFGWKGYQSANKFDFGATTATQVGYFDLNAVSATVQKTDNDAATELPTVDDASKNYVRIVAAKGTDDVYTIKSLQELQFKVDGTTHIGAFSVIDDKNTKVIIDSGKIGSMTLAADAIVLPEKETERDFQIAVTNAKAGSTFTGFAATDTVAGTLKSGETLTIVTTDETGKEAKFVWAGGTSSTEATIRGDGKAVAGTFNCDGKTALEGGADDGSFTTKVSGAAAQIVFSGGDVSGIYELGSGTLKVEKTTKAGAVSTTTYTAVADGSNITVTKKTVSEGVEQTWTTTTTASANIVDADYVPAGDPTLKSTFDWTAKGSNGAGYFKVTGVKTSAGKVSEFESVTVEKQTKFTAEKGAYYLKVALADDGKVATTDGITLIQLKEDGTLSDDLLTNTTKGAITVDAAGVALSLDATQTTLTKVGVEIKNAGAKSNVIIKENDTLTTATLAADDKVTVQVGKNPVNAKTFTSGASAVLEVIGTGTTPVVVNGSIKCAVNDATPPVPQPTNFTASGEKKDAAADDVAVAITPSGTDTPVVTVVNGLVTNVTGITRVGTSVEVDSASGADLTYGMATDGAVPPATWHTLTIGGTFSGKTIKTAPLAAGTVISEKVGLVTTEKLKTAADGELVLVYEGEVITVSAGKLQLPASGTITAAGATSAAADNTVIAAAAGNTGTIKVEIGDNGTLKSIQGLKKDDVVTVTTQVAKSDTDSTLVPYVETYTATTSTSITKTVSKNGEALPNKGGVANITAEAEILKGVTYIGGDTPIDANENPLEGQLNWADVSGRATGYFELAEKTKTVSGTKIDYKTTTGSGVVEQTTKQAVKIPKAGKKNYYLQASVDNTAGNELTFTAWEFFSEDGKTIKTQTALDITDKTKFSANDMVTITAGTTRFTYNKGTAQFGVTINKLATRSAITGLDAGDKVTTATLDNTKGERVMMDGVWYAAGAKNALTFIGEGDAAPTSGPATNAIRLLSGTIALQNGETAYLAGSKDAKGDATDATNDVKVEVASTGADKVIVNVKDGIVKSITGLTTLNATATITANGVRSVYKVVSPDGTMIERKEYKVSDDTLQSTGYRTVVKGKEIYDAKANSEKGTQYTIADPTTAQGVDWASDKVTTYIKLPALSGDDANKTLVKNSADEDVKKANFQASYGEYYLQIAMTTARTGITTISAINLQQADAKGKLSNVKVDKNGNPKYTGTLTIDGTMGDGKFAKISYKLPTTKTWTFKATNVALGTTFTNLGADDVAQTADGSKFALGTDGKSFTVYVTENLGGGVYKLSKQDVTFTGGNGAQATYTTANGLVVTGLDTKGETLTVVSDSATGGLVTTKYTVQADGTTIKKEVTNEAGVYRVYTSTTDAEKAESTDATIGGVKFLPADTTKTKIASDFDWTLDKSATAYATITSNTAAIKTGKNPAVKAGTNYIALMLDGATAKDGVVASVRAVQFDATTGVKDVENAITNTTITLNAPTKFAMTFDRASLVGATLDTDTTKFAVVGAVHKSKFLNLATDDTVKTGALATVDSWDDTEYVEFDGGVKFRSGKNKGQLSFTKTDTGYSLTSGTVKLKNYGDNSEEGVTFVYAGTNRITADHLTITVTATTTASAGTTFTIGELGEGEVFRVEDAYGNEWKYSKSGKTLFCEKTGETETMVMNFTKTSITSKELISAAATPAAWKLASAETLTDTEAGNKAINTQYYKALTIDLATLDSRVAKDVKKSSKNAVNAITYDFVVDTYLAPAKQQANLLAQVINDAQKLDLQTIVGTVWAGDAGAVDTTRKSYSATGTNKVGQTIKAAKDWDVTGSEDDDVIIGASSTSAQRTTLVGIQRVNGVMVDGGAGNDTITGGGATENFVVGSGNDVLKSYATGKDQIFTVGTGLAGGFEVKLDGSATVDGKKTTGVLLYDAMDEDGKTTNSVLLAGMGNGKEVKIDGKTYFFGDGTKTKGAMTFTYETGAYYFANSKLTNTLKVTTAKDKKSKTTLGDNVVVDLTRTDLYYNIGIVDASGSGNSVYLTANNDADSKTTLKGGSYQSTLVGGAGSDSLVGGSGEDVFWFEGLAGSDTVASYTSTKDAIYLGNSTITLDTADTSNVQIAALGTKDVLLSDGNNRVTIAGALGATKAVRISTDGTTKNTLSYYVGSTGKANNFTATIGTDMIAGEDDPLIKGADGAKLKDYSSKSYYVGSTGTDAVKLSSKAAVNGVFSMNTFANNLSSIEVLDATGIFGNARTVSSIALIGSTTKDGTLRGSTNANVHEKFVVDANVKTVVENLTKISDVIECSGTIASYSTDKSGNTTFTFEEGGQLTVSKVKYDSLSVNTKAGVTSITRTK